MRFMKLCMFSICGLIGLTVPFTVTEAKEEQRSASCPEVGTYVTDYEKHTTWKGTDFEHEANNPTSTPDTVSRSVAISHQATVSLGGEYEFKTLMSGAKISANVGYGYNHTKTVTVTWSVPKGRWNLVAGDKFVKSTGTRYKIAPPCKATDGRTVSATYTYKTWSDKVRLD
ncbi:hypothetical protein A374_14265 [Fictibacillus macauensis ZFHKF-1]|uniref:Uncharacterized protein n=1 Tax=Fictibacillus macauensis ZFHKF-1 TaxID=1196324 RepID=I8UDH5_9BACL|nr:hypothetical protein [Fictibacillus macauensis]EIT84863.1 hypothetical protein A374_14265 [Fictibacillus macauensis ZFHKF-1]